MRRLGLAALVALITACGIEPLSVWRVSIIPFERPSSCYEEGSYKPTRTTSYSGVEFDLGVWEMYEGADSKFFLKGSTISSSQPEAKLSGPALMEGSYAEGKYTFLSQVISTQKDKFDSPTVTLVGDSKKTVVIEIAGDAFKGTYSQATTYACTGTCDPDFAKKNPNCTVSAPISGTRVEADNLYLVGGVD